MTDHANELRRHARKIPHPQGETPGVMLRAADEIERLRAKIEAMEKQEPVAWMLNCQTLGGDTGWILSWTQSGAGLCNRLQGEENEKRLYALPGAQPAPRVPDGVAEALQRLIENGAVLGPSSSEDALLVARYRQHLLSSAPSVPEGWKLVPIVSTAEMDNAGADHCDGHWDTAQAVWDAMLAAAPEAKP